MAHAGQYTVAGVTYDTHTGLPISFEQNTPSLDYYTGPPAYKSQVGTIQAESGVKYDIFSDYNQNGTEVRDQNGRVVYEGFTNVNDGNVAEGFAPSFFTEKDIKNIKSEMGQAVAGGNLKQQTGLSNIPPAEGNADIEGVGKINPDFGKGDNDGDPLKHLEFGQVDHILQRLSLRNLKYPIDADYGNTQDYMLINQFTYRPPSKGIFFPEGGMKEGIQQGVDILKAGVKSGTPKEKAIGLVKLPMPNTLVDSNNVSWGKDTLNAVTAAVSSAAMGVSGDTLNGLINFIQGFDTSQPLEALMGGLKQFGQGAQDVFKEVGSAGSSLGQEILRGDNANVNLLGRTVVGSSLLNFLQQQVSPETILARGAGVVPNNNLALLFNSPTLREFEFAWKMSPRSKEEAIRINNILRFFKQGMAVKKATGTQSGGASYFLGTPNVFDITFKTGRSDNDFYEILDRNDSVVRIKTSACVGATVNYTPEGQWNAYEKGQPVTITLKLKFSELEPIFDTDYDDNYFNYDPQRTDLLPVPIDAVGY